MTLDQLSNDLAYMGNKIAIGINIFGEFHRQNLCIDSLLRIKAQSTVEIKLFNIQQKGLPLTEHSAFETIFDQGRTAANTVSGGTMNLPMVRDMFDALAEQDADYFVFLNSDIILTRKALRVIERSKWHDAVCCSRLAIDHIDSINDSDITHSHLQIAGFDVWIVRSNWWKEHRLKFPDYVYAISAWDVDYASRLMVLSRCEFNNAHPAPCMHIIHEEKSHNDSPERAHNMKLFFEDNKLLCDAWHKYLFETVKERGKYDANFLYLANNEHILLNKTFKDDKDLYSFCANRS